MPLDRGLRPLSSTQSIHLSFSKKGGGWLKFIWVATNLYGDGDSALAKENSEASSGTTVPRLTLPFHAPSRRMAGRLTALLHPSRISLNVHATKRTVAIHEVARLLESHTEVTSFQGFYNELLARERLDTTCLGNEIALPHARTEHVQSIVLSVGRSEAGVLFENSNQKVRLLFVLGTPKSNPGDYLLVVSALCRLLKEPAHREALMQAATPEDFIEAVRLAEEGKLIPASAGA